ncbi:MAG TPA: VWA domain-containing protein [Candidatus Acetothermia bacterium]|nr:VWA domain-containing protein [Candidatus Acetothermia bacterium]
MRGKTWLLMTLLLGSLLLSGIAFGASNSIVFILDASNSMNKPLGAGSRLDSAKAALIDLWQTLPNGTNVGLYLFGHRVGKGDREASCKDIEPLFPIRPFDDAIRADMTAAINAVQAKGLTPLADVLVQASTALASAPGKHTIILVSDGEETCGGDPLTVAQMLATLTPPVVLDIIGLDVDPAVRKSLTGMAEATGGKYYHVSQAKDLLSALTAATTAEQKPAKNKIPPQYAGMGITNVIYGTEGNDTLYGTPGNDLIFGLGGDDFIIGLGGNDILIGGPGNDIIEGMDGCDIISGGPGNDVIFGGNGDDLLCGNAGNDSIEGEAGNDILSGGPGCDKLLGGTGVNLLYTDGMDATLWQGKVIQGKCPTCLPPVPCTTCQKPQMPTSSAPVGCAPAMKSVDEGTSIKLHGTATDSDCGVVSVLWSAPVGSFDDPTKLDPMYTAPMVNSCSGADVCVTLVATDNCGAKGTDSFVLHINNVNHPPIINAGKDMVVDEGATVQLCATASDPDGDALKYHWSIPCGKGELNDPTLLNAVFTAPLTSVCEGENIVLMLSVIDSCGASTEDTVTIHVRNLNKPPIVKLGPGFAMKEGTTSILHAVASDPECGPLTYTWTASAGSFDNACSATPCFIAPQVNACGGEDVTVSLTVTDVCGASASDSYVIHVDNVNTPPVVKADP